MLPLPELLDEVLEASGYRAMLADGSEDGEERWANLLELRSVTTRYDDLSPEDALDRLLEETALVADQDSYEGDADAVTLITLHAAKGLEFPVVFIAGLEEGLFPHSRALDDEKELEEERRLAYVGITRAKRRLFLSHAWRRATWGMGQVVGAVAVPARDPCRADGRAGPERGGREASTDAGLDLDLDLAFGARRTTRFGTPVRAAPGRRVPAGERPAGRADARRAVPAGARSRREAGRVRCGCPSGIADRRAGAGNGTGPRRRAAPPDRSRRAPLPRRRTRPPRPLGRRHRRDVEADTRATRRSRWRSRTRRSGARRCSRASPTWKSSGEGRAMSHDWLIATRTRPPPTALDTFATSAGIELTVAGAFRPGANALVTHTNGTTARTIDVDGPDRAEPDDLPDDLAGAVTKPAWLVAIHLPGGYAVEADGWTLELAIHLARVGDGAVFDPQADRLVWPTGVTPRARGQTKERIWTLDVTWIIPASRLGDDAAARWLDLASQLFPAAEPVRFGQYEPLQGRLDRDGPEAFIEAWRAEAAVDFGGMLFWTAARPGIGGSMSFPDLRPDRRPPRFGRVGRLGCAIDARPLHRDPAVADATLAFFREVASSFGAAFATGSVERDAILERGRFSSDQFSETSPLARSRWWVGLPAIPTWLAWYGEPYRDLIADHFARLGEAGPDGLLVRAGAVPLDRDELEGVVPPPPAALRATRRAGSTIDPAARFTLVAGPPSEPAEVIPWID